MKTLLFLLTIFLFIHPCFAEMAQEVIIPGITQTPPTTNTLTTSPISQTKKSPLQNPLGNKKLKIPTNATDEELQQLITSVDLKGWSVFANYLWTCTPNHFTLTMYNAKNEIQAEFNKYKKNNRILTIEKATTIVAEIARPVDYQIPGLKGISCGVNITVANRKNPYLLKCYFILLDARYLSQLSRAVADNSGKDDVLPSDTLNAIQALLNASNNNISNCTKS